MGSQFWSKPTNISVLILLVLRHTKITTFFFSFFKSNFIKCCFDLNDRARLSRPLDWGYRASESQMWPPGSSSCPQRKLLWWKVRGGGEVVSDVTLSLEHVFSKASDHAGPHQLTSINCLWCLHCQFYTATWQVTMLHSHSKNVEKFKATIKTLEQK